MRRPQITIEPDTGHVIFADVRLHAEQCGAEVARQVSAYLVDQRVYPNDFRWLYLSGLEFGEQAAKIGLCLNREKLDLVTWSVSLPGKRSKDGWPTQEAIDDEISFVRRKLTAQGFQLTNGSQRLAWGEVYSLFDPKGALAANGLRYL